MNKIFKVIVIFITIMVEDKVPVEKRKGAIKKLLVTVSDLEKSANEDSDYEQKYVKDALECLNNIKIKLSADDVPSSKDIMAQNVEIENIKSLLCYLYSILFKQY
jgi:cytochrome c556